MTAQSAPHTPSDWLVADSLAPTADAPPLDQLYAAAAEGTLVLPFCPACDLPMELEQEVCDGCLRVGAAWRAVEPSGAVHSSTLVHRREPGLIVANHPYPIVDVELSSGHRLVMTTIDPTDAAPAIGSAVTVDFRRVGGVAVPAARIVDYRAPAPNPEDPS